ncbi:MAG TPA: hypothetical protein VGO58_04065 [Chitinophagaceae bacterium]|jgi:hypothetical protein|nr:hypothetical protein [Chitinophagaceae bacterium]
MKKFLAVLALVGVLASCKDKKKTDTPPATDDTATVKTTDPVTPPPTTDGATPKFADADVQAYADAYAAYAEAYKKAADSKDMTKFSELSKQGQDLATKATAMSQKIANSPEEAKKLSDFIMAKTAEITEYTKKMTGQ